MLGNCSTTLPQQTQTQSAKRSAKRAQSLINGSFLARRLPEGLSQSGRSVTVDTRLKAEHMSDRYQKEGLRRICHLRRSSANKRSGPQPGTFSPEQRLRWQRLDLREGALLAPLPEVF